MINKVSSVNNRTNYKQNFGMAIEIKRPEVRTFFNTTNSYKWTPDAVKGVQNAIEGLVKKHKDDKYVTIVLDVIKKGFPFFRKPKFFSIHILENGSKLKHVGDELDKNASPQNILDSLDKFSQLAESREAFFQNEATKKAGDLFAAIKKPQKRYYRDINGIVRRLY